MTDLIPRDAVRNEIARLGKEFLDGGSPTAANVLNLAMDRINTIPTIDPAVIREAALKDAADHFASLAVLRKMWSAAEVEKAILALIGEKK